MDHLSQLESRTIYIIREAYSQFKKIALLWSIGKDSTTMLWIARKAFFGEIPFPVIHIDTGFKLKEIYKFRESCVKLWDLFSTKTGEKDHLRVHPMLHWTEVDIWEYIRREKIPTVSLYFSKEGRRYRSIGCAPCCAPVDSKARNLSQIIRELKKTKTAERSGRAQDKEDTYTMQTLRSLGYM